MHVDMAKALGCPGVKKSHSISKLNVPSDHILQVESINIP